MENQPGLEWVSTLWGPEPTWTKEPDIDIVAKTAHRHLGLTDHDAKDATLEFISQGAFNKLYKITCSRGLFAMRVSLPVEPRFKTSSEAATLDLIHKHTMVPVPKVIAVESSYDNEIGFEWILMDFVPGTTLETAWSTITGTAKCQLVEKVVDITAELFRLRSDMIGSIYRANDIPKDFLRGPTIDDGLPLGYGVGPIVAMQFFQDKHLSLDIPRGPFPSSREWLAAILLHKQYDCGQAIEAEAKRQSSKQQEENSKGEDDEDENEMTRVLIARLSELLPKFFPAADDAYETFALRHDDFHHQNLMIDTDGILKALVDWECVAMVPLWKVCQIPSLLEGRDRTEEPQAECYSRNDNGTVDEMYDEHLQEYELTRLRKIFFDRMEVVEPKWMEGFRALKAKADFAYAVENCDTPFCRRRIGKWLDNVVAEVEQPSLRYSMAQD